MNHDTDTIAAISTPVGQGGIGIVRISGPSAIAIADGIFRPADGSSLSSAPSHALLYGTVMDPQRRVIVDEALLSIMRAPRSYTREDVAEINCHGGPVSVRLVLSLALSLGARLAEPGEFTKRAFLNGRINLAQAEAVSDLISAVTEESLKIAASQLRGRLSERLGELREGLVGCCALIEACIDFSDDIESIPTGDLIAQLAKTNQEIRALSATFDEAHFFRDGVSVAIAGRPNVGKSSLLNALLQKDRAIVTAVPGTTRDLIEEVLNIRGLPVRIVDTAGIRHSTEIVEQEGIKRSLAAIDSSDFVILVLDGSMPETDEDRDLLRRLEDRKAVIAVNKSDLPQKLSPELLSGKIHVSISALRDKGTESLKQAIFDLNVSNWSEEREGIVVTNLRHRTALDRAAAALDRAQLILRTGEPLEFCAIDVREAVDSIGGITGTVTTDEVLNRIFSQFCIGK